MILGIDVGGTHTDAVCVERGRIASTAKTVTGDDLVASIVEAVGLLGVEPSTVSRLVLSTTLSTNAIVEAKYPPVGVICSAGPGIDPNLYAVGECFRHVSGSIDHRGREIAPIDAAEVTKAARDIKDALCEGVAVVSKFSVRNPAHENAIASIIDGMFENVCLGHTMGGALNFPRRIHTAYLNTAVMPVQKRFMASVTEAVERLGIHAPIYFLKADGGTYTSGAASRLPVETILSGPAASVMGSMALDGSSDGDAWVMDIGGTTTDIGIIVNGVPLLEPRGVSIHGLATLVRGLKVVSVGVGGDSSVDVTRDRVIQVGPVRHGMPACMGGPCATPMDALVALGAYDADAELARRFLEPLAARACMDLARFCEEVVDTAVQTIADAAHAFLDDLNSHPVYTIHEMLHPDIVKPRRVVLVGGPASLLGPAVSRRMGLPVDVPSHAEVANALGAALARTTAQITLHADTELGRVVCPELALTEKAPRSMTLSDLKELGIRAMEENAGRLGLSDTSSAQVIDQQFFAMVRGFSTVGANMRMRIQTTPGIIDEWRARR